MRSARRAAERAGEKFDPVEVFERDGWRCGICRGRVDQALTHPHPWSASLDHIVPLSRGGGHVRENVQCSHLGCNRRKWAHGAGQLLLFG